MKQLKKTRMKLIQRQRFAYRKTLGISLLTLLILTIAYQFAFVGKAPANVTGDYRTKASGNWNATGTWETYNGSAWVAAGSTPNSSHNVITIQDGHTVSVTAAVTVDQVIVASGGTLAVNASNTMTLANGAGTDLNVQGSMTINGTLTVQASASAELSGTMTLSSGGGNTYASGSSISINNGGRYIQRSSSMTTSSGIWTVNSGGVFQSDINGATLPLAIWNSGATCEITGITSTKPTNLNQTFSNFTWNCVSQSAGLNLAAALTNIAGNFNFIASGSSVLYLSQSESSFTTNIGGNLNVSGGILSYTTDVKPCTLNIAGDFIQTGGTFRGTDILGSLNGDGTPTVNISGNFLLYDGTFDMTRNIDTDVNQGIATLNLSGNFIQTGGTFTETAAQTTTNYGYGRVFFVKSGTQIFSRTSGTMSNTVHFTVNNGSILDLGTSFPEGSGSFTVSSGGALIMASPQGITSSGATGNVQVTGTRTYSSSANYTFDGEVSQVTGNGLPSTVNNLTINNPTDVILTNTVSVSGILTMQNGKFITGIRELIVTNSSTSSINGHSNESYVIGNLRRYVNSNGSYDFPVGTNAHYEKLTLNFSGMTGFTHILATFTNANPINPTYPLSNISINGTAVDEMLDYGYWTMTPNAAMTAGTYSVTLNEKGHSNPVESAASYSVLKRANVNSPWVSQGVHNNATQSQSNGIVTAIRSGLSSFSQFGIGKHGGVGGLPIVLTNFAVKLLKDSVRISWETTSELNNDYFTVERSANGQNFETVTHRNGAGNSVHTIQYESYDPSPLPGQSYYRLKQTDYDGKFTYSEIKSVKNAKFEKQRELRFNSVNPNPFENDFEVSYTMDQAEDLDFILINSAGQVVYKTKLNAGAGLNLYQFPYGENLHSGVYFAVLINKEERVIKQVFKK
ncbi:MAG: T9SS C-terminal target domain-containing protein [Bacteroidetes bacterium]|nr:MAG: T9SS C-terminal target domain-containing protein [Bacteroidota bacterium]REK00974.1 MAG: T9SS C-terminal target domain-containing protein [Bacteroidota bacterium]REK51836.1 MAG: T9SS C-terminal target domain-containing protein [Bacteroidota bacterium]